MKTVAYSCPFVPPEWIAAHGLKSRRLLPGSKSEKNDLCASEGICHFLRELVNDLVSIPDLEGIVFTTICDQMRRAPELLGLHTSLPVFLMNVPSTWQQPESHRLYISELHRLSAFLMTLGGKRPTLALLSHTMLTYEGKRSQLLDARARMDARSFSETLASFHETGELVIKNQTISYDAPRGIPVALIGGPLSKQDFILFDIIQKAGGVVVLDGTETGERTLPRPFHRQLLRQDPILELADAYFGHIPDPFRRPNSGLYKWMKETCRTRRVQGVIFIRNVWCDIWHGEVTRMREWLNIPLLDIDLDGEDPVHRNKTRIQAFVETLR